MGMGLKKVTNFLLGVDEEDFEDEYEDSYEDEDIVDQRKAGIENISKRRSYSTLAASQSAARGSARGSVREVSPIRNISPSVNVHDDISASAQIDISYPGDIDSAREVIDNIKRGVYSIVNLESVDSPLAQRIADFLSGAVDALDGNIRRLSHDMFVITPPGVEITGEIDSDINSAAKSSSGKGLSWLSSSLK